MKPLNQFHYNICWKYFTTNSSLYYYIFLGAGTVTLILHPDINGADIFYMIGSVLKNKGFQIAMRIVDCIVSFKRKRQN